MARFPAVALPEELAADLAARGGRPVNLYHLLANAPVLLSAWIDFLWALRQDCRTPRALRELIILRTAQLQQSSYEWHQHRMMAERAGLEESKVAELAMWPHSTRFDARERAALRLTDAVVRGEVDDEAHAEAARTFTREEHLELALTAAAYCMVARMISVVGASSEGETEPLG